jgi:PilZ domain
MSPERRTAPRKPCAVPVRFRVRTEIFAPEPPERMRTHGGHSSSMRTAGIQEGETINISELGLYFKSTKHVAFGEEIEVSLKLPVELTGRGPEQVKCSARVIHVERSRDGKGMSIIGAAIGRFAKVAC